MPRKAYSGDRSWGDLLEMRCEEIAPPDNVVTYTKGVLGSHPFHGSETGTNFDIDIKKNAWICRRHNSGGGPLELYAMKYGIIQCDEVGPGCLNDHWAEVFAALKKDGYDLSLLGVDTTLTEQRVEIRDMLQAMGVL